MRINDNNIKQTIIKGYRKTFQLVGLKYEFGIPKKDYACDLYEAKSELLVFDDELLCQRDSRDFRAIDYIFVSGKKTKILKEYIKDDVFYIIVDIHVEKEDREIKYEKDAILEEYNKEMDKYWEDFTSRYSERKELMALIEVYQKQGMEREDIIPLILEHTFITKPEKNITVPIISTQNYEQKNPKNSPTYLCSGTSNLFIETSTDEMLSSLAGKITRITWQ